MNRTVDNPQHLSPALADHVEGVARSFSDALKEMYGVRVAFFIGWTLPHGSDAGENVHYASNMARQDAITLLEDYVSRLKAGGH